MGDPIITTSLALVQGGMGAAEQNKAKHTSEKLYSKSEKFFDLAKSDFSKYYDEAIAKLGGAGAAAKQSLSEQGVQQVGGLTSSAIDRGLYGSSFLDAGKRAIGSDVSRGRVQIDEQSASMIANMLQGKAGGLANLDLAHAQGLQAWKVQPGQAPDLLGWAKLIAPGGFGGGGASPQPQGNYIPGGFGGFGGWMGGG